MLKDLELYQKLQEDLRRCVQIFIWKKGNLQEVTNDVRQRLCVAIAGRKAVEARQMEQGRAPARISEEEAGARPEIHLALRSEEMKPTTEEEITFSQLDCRCLDTGDWGKHDGRRHPWPESSAISGSDPSSRN